MYKIITNSLFLGKNLIYLPKCHSTNAFLTNLTDQSNLPEGSCVVCSEQTAGRGQRGNIWLAEPNLNLTFSFLLKPHFLQISEQFCLNMVVTLGIYDALFGILGKNLKIKWANDMYFGQKKLAGILIENTLQSAQIIQSVIGIGLNVNQEYFTYPNAISLYHILGKETDLQTCLESILIHIEKRYLALRSGQIERLKTDYYSVLYGYQETQLFENLNPENNLPSFFEGQILGVDKIGKLAVAYQNKVFYFDLKEIRFIT